LAQVLDRAEAAEAELVEWKATVNVLMGERTTAQAERDEARRKADQMEAERDAADMWTKQWADEKEAAEAEVERLREALTGCPPDCIANLHAALAHGDTP
jgi:alkanesulfonate monooxygenase SsuD/methylene tetrahydromethanopterin reductase-like flavin-dependent oxidoreductase (luciferase family)